MKFKGTILAVVIIILLFAAIKFGKIGFERRDELVEPTEAPTLGFLENTSISSMPSEN